MTISVQTTPNNNSKKEEDSDHADSDSIVTATHTVNAPLLSGCSITTTTTTNTTAATSVTPLHWNKHQQSPHSPNRASVSLSPVRVALQRAGVILPHQAILENFVHSNPLQNFQHFEYKQAIDYMERLDDNMSPGERTAFLTGTDLRKREKGAVVDLSAAFLDRGAAKWAPAMRDNGFLVFLARLERKGFAPWRFYARQVAAKVLLRLDEHIRGTTTTTTTTGRQDKHISITGSGAMSI
jgi:hypothetical protein